MRNKFSKKKFTNKDLSCSKIKLSFVVNCDLHQNKAITHIFFKSKTLFAVPVADFVFAKKEKYIQSYVFFPWPRFSKKKKLLIQKL